MSLAFNYQGNASFGGDALLATTLSGTAATGDILVLNCMGGVDGGGLGPIDVFDNIDPTGGQWHSLVDEVVQPGTPDTYTLHNVVAWKIAQGGETSVSINFTAGNANKAMEVLWIADPSTQTWNDVYLLQDGPGAFDSGSGHQVLDSAPPGVITSDGEAYVGFTASSRDSYSFANLMTNGSGADGGGGQNLGGAANVIIHHWYGSGSGLTTDVVKYATNTYNNPWMGALGVRHSDAPVDVELESTGGLVGGDAELTADSPASELESTGGLVGGDSTLTVEGGQLPLASVGAIVGGQAHLSAPEPFPPVPNTPPLLGFLGCGIYDVFVFTRGLREIVGRIPFNELSWARVLDDTSTAEVTVNGVSNVGSMRDCCQLLGSIQPYKHEIGLYRNGRRVWSGPVTKVSFPSESVIIDAADLSYWLSDRELHDGHNDVQQDLADIWAEYVTDAMSVDNSPGLYPIVQAPTGVLADRLYTPDMGTVAADAIAELARTGLDWTCTDRRMVGGPVQQQPAPYPNAEPIPTLIDESFRDSPTVERDGAAMANCWFVGGSGSGPGGAAIFGEYGPEFPATPDHIAQPAAPDYAAIEDEFGRIEARVNETKILDQGSIDQNAATRYDLTKRPVDVISSGTLLPSAGIDISQLTAGSIQNVHLTRACVQIGAPYRLKQLSVTAQNDGAEQVEGVWEPIGSVAAHEDLG